MQWYRSQDAEVEALIEHSTASAGFPATEAECYWCRLYDDKRVPAVSWFMDEAACKPHLRLGQRWAAYALRATKA